MPDTNIVTSFFLIFTGAAVISTGVLFTRQSLLVAYIALGALFGPWGFKLVSDASLINQIGEVGIIFLLFLLGLHLHPQNLIKSLRKVSWVTLLSSIAIGGVSYLVAIGFGLNNQDALIIGTALIFSSTIIGLKLLPTAILHHQHTGEVVISVLLFQDLIAVIVLLLLDGAGVNGLAMTDVLMVCIALPGLILFAFLVERFVLIKLITRFDRYQEYIFLLALGWCLGMAELANFLKLSVEVGAFIAGVSIATNPISLFIAESLKPLRDFFLVMFFFAVGASINLYNLTDILLPAALLAGLLLVLKPLCYGSLLKLSGEEKKVSWEVGVRLGQASEFSLLVAYLATSTQLLSERGSYLIQVATVITFIISSYFVIMRYPTPMGTSEKLRRD